MIKKFLLICFAVIVALFSCISPTTDFQYTNDSPGISDGSLQNQKDKTKGQDDYALLVKMKQDFEKQKKINSDTHAWMNIPNIGYYPVMFDNETSFYLSHGADKKPLVRGALFMSPASKGTLDDTCLIYGHHMKSGAMFGSLKKYKDSLFLQKNKPIILYDGKQYSVYQPYSSFEIQDGKEFVNQGPWVNAANREKYMKSIWKRSIAKKKTGFQPNFGNNMLFLQTCDYDFKNARLVIASTEIQKIQDPAPQNIKIKTIS